jgi:hypothetical protein
MIKSQGVESGVLPAVVAPLLTALEAADVAEDSIETARAADRAEAGLRALTKARPRDVLEHLLPMLLPKPARGARAQAQAKTHPEVEAPLSRAWSRALAAALEVSEQQLPFHVDALLPRLCAQLTLAAEAESARPAAAIGETDETNETDQYRGRRADVVDVQAIMVAVARSLSGTGVQSVVIALGKLLARGSDGTPVPESVTRERPWAVWCLECLVSGSHPALLADFACPILKNLLECVCDPDAAVVAQAGAGLRSLATTLTLEGLSGHISFIRSCLNSCISDARHRPGAESRFEFSAEGAMLIPLFALPKGVEPLLPLYTYTLASGGAAEREEAADAISDLVGMCHAPALKPYLVKTAGPLIRVVGERVPSCVKAAILQALAALLKQGGVALRPFVPQLQTTFAKSLCDPTALVRQRAVTGLSLVAPFSPRLDPLLSELCVSFQSAPANSMRTSILHAMRVVLDASGGKSTATALEKLESTALEALESNEEAIREAAASLCGGLAQQWPAPESATRLATQLSDWAGQSAPLGSSAAGTEHEMPARLGAMLALGAVGCVAGARIDTAAQRGIAIRLASALGSTERAYSARVCAARALARLLSPSTEAQLAAAHGAAAVAGDESAARQEAWSRFAGGVFAACASALVSGLESEHSELQERCVTIVLQASRHLSAAAAQLVEALVPPVEQLANPKSLNIAMRLHAEHALKHLLRAAKLVESNDLDPFCRDFARRVNLAGFKGDSDDELDF